MLGEHPSVTECVVLDTASIWEHEVTAFFDRRSSVSGIQEVRRWLRGCFDDRMLPTALVCLVQLPCRDDGEIDLERLRERVAVSNWRPPESGARRRELRYFLPSGVRIRFDGPATIDVSSGALVCNEQPSPRVVLAPGQNAEVANICQVTTLDDSRFRVTYTEERTQ